MKKRPQAVVHRDVRLLRSGKVREGLSEEVTFELNVRKKSPPQRTGEASKRKHHMQRS